MNFIANNLNELQSKIKGLDIKVPKRGEGRTTDQCEQWQIHKLLLGLLQIGYLETPFELKKRERPDFCVKSGNNIIGIEATEIINPDYAKLQTLPEAKSPSSVLNLSMFKWTDKERCIDDLREIAKKQKLIGPAWKGDRVEIDFAQSIVDTVLTKHNKLNAGFERFDRDFLLIYHNNSTPILDLEKASNFTSNFLGKYWCDNGFNQVIVQKYSTLLLFSRDDAFQIDVKS